MRNHALAAALGVLTAAFLVPCGQSHAAGSDPSGYWYKPDAERESKIQVFKCGKGKLCAKIVWLKNPNDSTGKPLHDVRNENPSMRGRSIVGLPLFSAMVQSAPTTWSGQIYNPEDGHTYSATLTLISRSEIKLRGCKAWLLCGEKQWLRTSAPEVVAPPAPAEGTEQIEASADPSSAAPTPADLTPAPAHAVAAAPAVPAIEEPAAAPATEQTSAEPTSAPEPTRSAKGDAEAVAVAQPTAEPQPTPVVQKADIATPAAPPAVQNAQQPGYGFLSVSASPDTVEKVSGENVSSMIDMTQPIASAAAPVSPVATAPVNPAVANAAFTQTTVQTASQAEEAVPLPAPKPKVKVKPKPIATASAAPKPTPKPEVQATAPAQAAPVPPVQQDTATAQADPDAQAVEPDAPVAAEASMDAPPLTRRQLRKLRRQQMQEEGGGFLPWLRSAN
jgi:uncharacterized protein (DUF2147 family)